MKKAFLMLTLLSSVSSHAHELFNDLNIEQISQYNCANAINDGFIQRRSDKLDYISFSKKYESKKDYVKIELECDIFNDQLQEMKVQTSFQRSSSISVIYRDLIKDLNQVFQIDRDHSELNGLLENLGDRRYTSKRYNRPSDITRDNMYDFVVYSYEDLQTNIDLYFNSRSDFNEFILEITF